MHGYSILLLSMPVSLHTKYLAKCISIFNLCNMS